MAKWFGIEIDFKLTLQRIVVVLLTAFGLHSCENNKNNHPPIPETLKGPFEIVDAAILYNDSVVSLRGVNAMQTFGGMSDSVLEAWNVAITREFIGNLGEQPIDGYAIEGTDGKWLHPLQDIVDRNRAQHRVTLLCPFGWVDDSGAVELFSGLNPLEVDFYQGYKSKMIELAAHFKDQPDVWIQVWNEPFHWDNQNGYSHALWQVTMEELVDNLRWVEGFENIIVVPGNEQGQSEEVLLTNGKRLLEGRYNVLFDVHAYEKWLVGSSSTQIKSRIQDIEKEGLALIFGEVGVHNVSDIMNPEDFLVAVDELDVSTLAWLFVPDSANPNALLNNTYAPNATAANNFWGSVFQSFLAP
jgi:mannan endo-1,4-beta-mannosidase